MINTKYTYSIQNDFLNHKENSDRLTLEIQNSSIIISLDYINTSDDECDIWFKDILSSDDLITLNNIVATHSGEPIIIPNEVLISGNQTPIPTSVIYNSSFYPDPSSYPDGTSPSNIDSSGNQQVRSAVFTDEGSFRDDFGLELNSQLTGILTFTNGSDIVTGVNTLFRSELNINNKIKYIDDGYDKLVKVDIINSDTELLLDEEYDGYTGSGLAISSKWYQNILGDGYIRTNDSKLELYSGKNKYSYSSIIRMTDTLPLKINSLLSLSGRENNQMIAFGLLDNKNNNNYKELASFYFDGTDNTVIKTSTGCDGYFERNTITLPNGLKTEDELLYEIEIGYFCVSFLINHILIAKHEKHIPKPYTKLYLGYVIVNLDNILNDIILSVENISISNHDQIQIGGSYLSGEPLSIRIVENSFTLTGCLKTTSTNANQIILSTIVPENKILFITGYFISNSYNSVDGDPIIIGKNDIENEPDSPGIINSNFFRIFRLKSGDYISEDFSANPRILGVSGDTVKIVTTPTGNLLTKWRATLDYVLR